MLNLKNVAAAGALLAATVAAPLCGAQSLNVLTAGSSAQWGVFAEAAYALAGTTTGSVPNGVVKHCTLSASNASLHDNRNQTPAIPDEGGKLWVVWVEGSNLGSPVYGGVWAYASVDSVVGVRAFASAPRASLSLSSNTASCAGLLSAPAAALFSQSDEGSLPSAVGTLLNGAFLTAANTDVRPEDALFATNRAVNTLNTTDWSGLGIGAGGVVTDTSMAAHVELFALSGTDPLTGSAIDTAMTTIPIGAAPIVFIANTATTGVGHLGDPSITLNINNGFTGSNDALAIFSGANCNATLAGAASVTPAIGVNAVLREPTSGTMNTTEYTNFRTSLNSRTASQEENATYPSMTLQTCAGSLGTRTRAIGTGNEVSAIKALTDGLGYAFWSVEAVPNATAAAPSTPIAYKYLFLNGVDPLAPLATTAHVMPVCGSNTAYFCASPTTSGVGGVPVYNSFQNLRSGSYDSWSVYRVFTNASGASAMQDLIDVAEGVADEQLPDFVPLEKACQNDTLPHGVTLVNPLGGSTTNYSADEPGLEVFRSHYLTAGVSPSNGAIFGSDLTCGSGISARTYHAAFVGGSSEAGGDVGGLIINVGNATPSMGQITNVGQIQ